MEGVLGPSRFTIQWIENRVKIPISRWIVNWQFTFINESIQLDAHWHSTILVQICEKIYFLETKSMWFLTSVNKVPAQIKVSDISQAKIYWAVQKNLVKGCRQTLDCYCVSCELLSASIADALWFVNMVCLPLIAEQNAHEICLTQECLQIVRRLLWKQTTTHNLRNNNPMFDGNLWPNSFEQPCISNLKL